MPVGNQLNYWDGAAWQKLIAPQGAQGIPGPQGPPVAQRASVGACAFKATVTGYTDRALVQPSGFQVLPGLSDINPCLTVKDTMTLTTARAGTIMMHYTVWLPSGVAGSGPGFIQIGNPHIVRYAWPEVGEELGTEFAVVPNVAVAFDFVFYLQLSLLSGPTTVYATVVAALQP